MSNRFSRLFWGGISAMDLATGLLLAMIATSAHGAVTTTVVDIPVTGATQRFLYVRPDAPVANIVALPGGEGILGIQSDGTIGPLVACFPVYRTRQALADGGMALALVDATSAGTVRDFNDVLEVVRYMQSRHNVPTWVIGGSSSTSAVGNLGANLPSEIPGGVIFFSPDRPASNIGSIRRPTLVINHSLDSDQFGSAMFNALTAAPVRERAVFSGGSSGGCGYHLFNGVEAEFAAAIISFVVKYNPSVTPLALNFQGLWWKSPAESESGWGINFAHQGDVIFASWFTYDATGKALWLVMTADKTAERTYTGTFFQTRGPAFNALPFSPSAVTANPVGSGTLTFSDAGSGSFAYTVNGISQTKAITRQVFGPLPVCTFGAQTNLALATNYQDLWWAAPAGVESGWGVNFTHQGDTIFATWFTYDLDGSPLWLSATVTKTGTGIYAGPLYRTTGPPFSAVPFLPSNIGVTAVGTLTLTFANGNAATFAYTVNGVTQSKPIMRQVFRAPGTVCQ